MKRILALILCILAVLPLIACGGKTAQTATEEQGKASPVETAPMSDPSAEEEESEEEKKTEQNDPVLPPHNVSDPLTWDKINAIPIANSSMSIAELRQICVDFFSLQVSFAWTPKSNTYYVIDSFNEPVKYLTGHLYGGIPYVNLGSNNLYRVMDLYDSETGVYDCALLQRNEKLAGNACSSSAGLAWGRVINSASLSYTSGHTPKAGFLPLGPYKTNYEVGTWGTNEQKVDVKDILKLNDMQTMYESYALLQPADGVVSGGHVRMAKEPAVVVRNADGTINGEESYVIFVEQGAYCSGPTHTRTQADGATYQIQGNDYGKFTFASLWNKGGNGYLPFTFAEWLGTDPVEKSETKISNDGSNLTVAQLIKAELSSNYIITDAFCVVKDASGSVVFNYAFRQPKHYLKSCQVSSVVPTSALSKFYDQNCTIEIHAQLSTGERPVVYSGPLIKG
ncbi:MAG: hypothetical protein IKC69_02775 [Clostridia bacterium]|nr:hypothetical protein [Clostridia bacterium]